MRIGMILDNEFTGDVRVENEVTTLLKKGHEVSVLCYNYGEKSDKNNFLEANIVRIFLPKSLRDKLRFFGHTFFDFYSLLWSVKISRFIKQHKIQILHVHDLYMAKPALIANKKHRLPIILDLHENYPAALRCYNWTKTTLGRMLISYSKWDKYEERYLSEVSKIIVLSDNFKNELINKYPQLINKITIYPNYPNVERLKSFEINKDIMDSKDYFVVFYFGGIAERRGIFTLFDSLKILLNESYKILLLLIGPVDKADSQKFYSHVNSEELKNNIKYYEWKDISLLPSYINISDVCVSPIIKNEQHESGVANKVFQYMLFGKPIIVSDCKPQLEVVNKEKCGLSFKSGDAIDLADKIKYLYNNRKECGVMGINGKKAVLEKYNAEIAGENLAKLYEEFNPNG